MYDVGLRAAGGEPELRAAAVPSGGKRPAGAQQGQQRRAHPHLPRRSHAPVHPEPPQPPPHRPLARPQRLHDPEEHAGQDPALLSLTGALFTNQGIKNVTFELLNKIVKTENRSLCFCRPNPQKHDKIFSLAFGLNTKDFYTFCS